MPLQVGVGWSQLCGVSSSSPGGGGEGVALGGVAKANLLGDSSPESPPSTTPAHDTGRQQSKGSKLGSQGPGGPEPERGKQQGQGAQCQKTEQLEPGRSGHM